MPLTVTTLPVKKCSGNDRSHFQNTNINIKISAENGQSATATTAACGRNREELLGPRPARCECRSKARSRCRVLQPVQAEAMLNRNLGDTTFMHEIIMGYQGEMSLKGLNRNQFESAMMKILRYRLKTVGKFKVYCTQSTFYMEPEEEDVDMDLAFDRVSKVFGLAALSRAVVCDKDFDTICQTADGLPRCQSARHPYLQGGSPPLRQDLPHDQP